MIKPTLLSLSQVVLPSEVLDSFDITKVESTPTEIRTEGTRYSREFATFLKETYRHIPCDLPYA